MKKGSHFFKVIHFIKLTPGMLFWEKCVVTKYTTFHYFIKVRKIHKKQFLSILVNLYPRGAYNKYFCVFIRYTGGLLIYNKKKQHTICEKLFKFTPQVPPRKKRTHFCKNNKINVQQQNAHCFIIL